MKITPTRRFRDGHTTFEPGVEYEVADADGGHYVRNGWATSPDYTPPGVEPSPGTANLRPDNARHNQNATEG